MSPPPLPLTAPTIDLATAEAILTAYLPAILDALDVIAAELRPRYGPELVTVRAMDAEDVMRFWSPTVVAVLAGFAMVDRRDWGKSFHWIGVSIRKADGALVVRDDWGLLDGE